MEVESPRHKPHTVPANIECYFSEINELVEETDYHSDTDQITKPLDLVKTKRPNCSLKVQEKGIVVVTNGGAHFNVPLEQEVEAVFPMVEGLLIRFTLKQDLKFGDILNVQRNKSLLDVNPYEEARYSYATINKHPLNSLKVLGCLRKEEITPWINSQDEIIFVSRELSLMISYNAVLQRNAFHLVRINLEEVQRESQRITFLNNFYTLKSISETASLPSELLTDVFFEENTKEERIREVIITQGKAGDEILLNVLMGSQVKTMRVYSLKFSQNFDVTLISEYNNVLFAEAFDLFDVSVQPHTLLNPEDQLSRSKDIYTKMVLRELRVFNKFLTIVDTESYSLLFNGRTIYRYSLNSKLHQATRSNPRQIEVVSSSSKTTIDDIRTISSPLVISILSILSQILNPQMYVKMLSDFINLKQNKHRQQPQLQTFKMYLLSLYTGLIDPSILKHKNIDRIQEGVLKVLHLFYQELKLFQFANYRQELLDLLFQISTNYGAQGRFLYCDYYLREGAQNPLGLSLPTPVKLSQETYEPIPDVFRFLSDLLELSNDKSELGVVTEIGKFPLAFKRTRFVLSLLEILVDGQHGNRSYIYEAITIGNRSLIRGREINDEAFPLFVQSGFYMKYFLQKMQGFNTLRETYELVQVKQQKAYLYMIEQGLTLQKIKTYPSGVGIVMYEILRIMREGLPNVLYSVIPKLGFSLIQREDIYKNIKLYKRVPIHPPQHLQNNTLASTIQTLIHSSTSEDYYLTSNTFEMNKINNDIVFEQVNRLLTSTNEIKIRAKELENIPEDRWELESQSIVAKFANRRLSVLVGQGAFTWGTSQTYITEIVKIPKINLSAIMPNDVKVTLDLKEDKESVIHWPEFHNGVAAGLRLSKHIIPTSQDHLKTWIFYQKPESPRRQHSGFLLSLGLLGYLRCFSPTDIYQYLKPNNELTSIALLLGVSASNISRCEQYISQTLIIHVLPSTVDMDIPINVQTSALIGIGLIHKGSCNRTMTEMTLSQIGRSPNTDRCLDREGYSLAAGWALGVTCLGMAGKRENLDDLMLEQRLIRFIEGGKMMDPPQSLISGSFCRQNKCSSIRQGPNVNLHITAPSALVAISLMYLKSNMREIHDQISIPDSFNLIQQCNPNLTLLKVIARNLIMWNSIDNTQEYLFGQIPKLIKFIYESSLQKVHDNYYLIYNVNEIDYHTISVVYASSLTGAVVAMGLKYAGTGVSKAVRIIIQHIERLKNMKILKYELINDPTNKNSIDQYTLFTLLSVSILSLSLIVAGTCDEECLRIARMLRRKIQDTHSFHYGFNMAINMAIGFICLGYGNYSFNRSDMSIAALFICIYPYFPNSPSDNKWHLQALRHFYVLAVEEKVFHAVDVDTNRVTNAKVEMAFETEGQIKNQKIHTPVLLQESKKLISVRVVDPDYFNVDFAFDEGITPKLPKVIYIKKKISKNINIEQFHHLEISENPEQFNTIRTFDNEVHFQSLQSLEAPPLSQSLIHNWLPSSNPNSTSSLSLLKLLQSPQPHLKPNSMKQLYYQFLKQDRIQIIEIYLDLISNPPTLSSLSSLSLDKLQNLKIISLFYRNKHLVTGLKSEESHFFCATKLEALVKRHNDVVLAEMNKFVSSGHFLKYLKQTTELDNQTPANLYKVLNHLNVPSRHELQLINSFFQKLLQESSRSRLPKQELPKQLSNVLQMYLYISFPFCPLNVLHLISGLCVEPQPS